MSPGSHAAGDGSYARSASLQAGRAALLIGVAVLIGVLLLHRTPGAGGGSSSVAIGGTTTTPTATPTSTNTGTGGTTATSRVTPTTGGSPLRAPQDIKVLVANGTTTSGLASRVSNLVHAKGYNTLASTNSSQRPASSIVFFQPSYSADAAALAAKVNLPANAVQAMASPPPVPNLNGANILLIAGPDLAGASSTTPST